MDFKFTNRSKKANQVSFEKKKDNLKKQWVTGINDDL